MSYSGTTEYMDAPFCFRKLQNYTVSVTKLLLIGAVTSISSLKDHSCPTNSSMTRFYAMNWGLPALIGTVGGAIQWITAHSNSYLLVLHLNFSCHSDNLNRD